MTVIDERTLDLFRGPGYCQMPHKAWCSHRQPHHWKCRGVGGGSRLDIRINIISLCPLPCHELVQRKREMNDMALQAIAAREETTAEAIEGVIAFLLRLDKNAPAWRIEDMVDDIEDSEMHRLARKTLAEMGKLTLPKGVAG